MAQALSFIARALLASYFLKAGLSNIQNPSAIEGMIKAKNIPLPKLAMIMVFIVQIIGSMMIILNFHVVLAALALIVFTIASNLLFCTFWTVEQGFQKSLTSFLFDANNAIIGGLLLLISFHL